MSPSQTNPEAPKPAQESGTKTIAGVKYRERTLKVWVPEEPNMSPDGIEFPATVVLVYANGVKSTHHFKAPKASAASGKINAWAGGRIALEDNTQVQMGCNLTVIE